jgi:hypothetical protein
MQDRALRESVMMKANILLVSDRGTTLTIMISAFSEPFFFI